MRPAGRHARTASCSASSSRLNLLPLFRAEITLGPVQELGEAPHGRRRIIPITGGKVSGERLSGRVLPGGADWQVIRADGVAELDARYTIETGDGALVYVANRGVRHGAPEVIRRRPAGDAAAPPLYYTPTTRWCGPGAARSAWLTRLVGVGPGARRPAAVELEVFEVK